MNNVGNNILLHSSCFGLTDEVCDDYDAHGNGVHGDGEGARPDVGVPEARRPAGLHVDVRDPGDLHYDGGFVTGV